MSESESVSHWIEQLKQGESRAAEEIWQRFHHRLVGLARRKLGDMPRRVADEDDVVASAFQSFCLRAQQGAFPQLSDRDELWSLLVVITARKAINQMQHQQRAKRGGGRVQGESVFAAGDSHTDGLGGIAGKEPTPEFAAQCAEVLQSLIEQLDDPTQRAIAVHKLEGCTNPEIARHLNCSLSAVERKLRIIRKRLAAYGDSE